MVLPRILAAGFDLTPEASATGCCVISSAEMVMAFNWQQGPSASHAVPAGTAVGDWAITGVRAHADTNDHSGAFTPIQAMYSVFVSRFYYYGDLARRATGS